MKLFLITLAVLATALAAPAEIPADSDGTVSVVQSSDGSYTLDVNLRTHGRKEERFVDGTVIGEYSVPDASGTWQTFKYMAGKDGFVILEGPLPVAPVDTNVPVASLPVVSERVPPVAAEEQMKTILANFGIPSFIPAAFIPQGFESTLPQGALEPVKETPEVQAARAEHLAAHRAALRGLGIH